MLDNVNEVKTEVGGSVSIDENSKIMGGVSNEGDLNFLLSNGGLISSAVLYAWIKRRFSSGLLEADVGCISSYNDLLLKVIQSHQANMEYSKTPSFKVKAKMEYDFERKMFVTPPETEFMHDLKSSKESSEFALSSKALKDKNPSSSFSSNPIAGIMMNLRYELDKLSAAVLKVERLALWYKSGPYRLWFQ